MTALIQSSLYVPRARMNGTLDWICAYSGHLNATRLSPSNYRLICTQGHCGRRYIPGLVFYPLPPGRQRIPPDWIIPADFQPGWQDLPPDQRVSSGMRESFPEGDLSLVPWRSGNQTHVLVDPRSADFNVNLFVRTVRNVAQHQPTSSDPFAALGAAFALIAAGHGFGDVG